MLGLRFLEYIANRWYGMVEPIPFIKGNELFFISSAADITKIIDGGAGCIKWYLWDRDRAYEITSEVTGCKYMIGDGRFLDLANWFEKVPWIYGRVVGDLDEYVDMIYCSIGRFLEGKKLLLSYSGGKDSTASLIILLKLMERVSFKLHVVYTYMPYLEPRYNLSFIEHVSRRLGLNVDVISPPEDIMRRYLIREGLPYRRGRWCTYLKTRPIREYFKKKRIDILVIGDRLWEATKRFYRLSLRAVSKIFLHGKKLYPIAPLTIIDVVNIVKRHGFIHPDYMHGAIRVSCYYCPYKSVFELKLLKPDVEDPGFIDNILKYEWIRWYRKVVTLEEFVENHLWRYIPSIAKIFAEAKKKAGLMHAETISLSDIRKYNTYIWTHDVEAPVLSYDNVIKYVYRDYRPKRKIVLDVKEQ